MSIHLAPEATASANSAEAIADQLGFIFRLLAAYTGVDFSDYRPTPLQRRLARRMALAQTADIASYIRLLQQSRRELELLHEDLLINVTGFFRDAECFAFLQNEILPALIARHADNTPLRLWVPGCSTGEEAYSIAILLRELLDERGNRIPVQIFGTDVSDRALNSARAGFYPPAAVRPLSRDPLQRFFLRTDGGYVVQKSLREMCAFTRQNVIKDLPFARLDLVSCRNLLIYLAPRAAPKATP